MDESQLRDFLTPLGHGSSWGAKCVRRLLDAENVSDVAQGLVTQNGHKPVALVKGVWNAWGIDMKTCHAYCDRQSFPMVFDFPIFTSGVTNYLLPWLGLTAQLPYETDSISGNFESFCLAVGSPMLTTFSLMSTTLNAHSTSKIFEAKFGNGKTATELEQAVNAAEYFLCGSQQSPIRIKEDQFRKLFEGEAGQLRDWWLPLKQRLHSTRRQYTFSLFAQTFFAVVAWVLTIIGSYVTSLGQHSEALLLSSGTLWTWLVPIVLGWMAVGVQSRENTVRDAIRGEAHSANASTPKALEAGSGFLGRSAEIPDALLGKVQGDERLQGPAYNYARTLTYPKLLNRVVCAFEEKLHASHTQATPAVSGDTGKDSQLLQVKTDPQSHDSAISSARNSASSLSQVPSTPYRRANTVQIENVLPITHGEAPYMRWNEVFASSVWIWNFLISNIVAVFLQWGVTGSAIVISYLTEVRGLGCRSGSYLVFGILATCAHCLLLVSVFLSHQAMLMYQEGDKLESTDAKPENVPRSWKHELICKLAVLTRYLGKLVAVVNATWIILSSIFELIGFYESCWCTGTVLGLGNKAWVVLFVSGDKMREDAEPSWIGGLAMSLLTIIITYFFSKMYSWGRKN